MSRLFIKGLPLSLSDVELQQHFQASGFQVTDAKVMHRSDGSSRGFAFAGFVSPEEAARAKKDLHQSFLHGSKLNVAVAREMTMDAAHEPNHKRRRLNGDAAATRKQAVTKPLPLPTEAPAEEEAESSENPAKAALTDAEYFASKLKRKLGDTLEPEAEDAPQEEQVEEQDDFTKNILKTGRLFVRNLPYHATADQLSAHFSVVGPCSLHLPADQQRSSTGVVYVHYEQPADALKAHQDLDGRPFLGRLIHLLPSVDKFTPAQPSKFVADPKKKSKAEQEHGQRSGATIVTNTDAVAASLAARLSLDKRDIIDATQSESAVKLALAETSLLDETRRYCAIQGIDLDALNSKSSKSHTVILLKNLPANTTKATLNSLLAQYGGVKRLAVPPSATLAFIEFEDPTSAKNAQRGLSYQKLGNSVIYVERMPVDLWSDQPLEAASAQEDTSPVAFDAQVKDASEAAPSSSLYVTNVGFSSTAETFERLFRSLAGFSYARLQPKRGFGFVGFKSTEQAEAAKSKMDGILLDGRPLKVAFSARAQEEEEQDEAGLVKGGSSAGKKYSTKLIVKNVPFEASAKDLKQLFSAVATLKSLRLPKRADKRSRGFAFVEFASSKDSAAAAQLLKHTHLLGRHLVLEESAEDSKPGIDFL